MQAWSHVLEALESQYAQLGCNSEGDRERDTDQQGEEMPPSEVCFEEKKAGGCGQDGMWKGGPKSRSLQ